MKKHMTRIATVKATGKRYILKQLNFQAGKAYVWGELKSYAHNGIRTTSQVHFDSKVFLIDAVEIAVVEQTKDLLAELWSQMVDSLRAKGETIVLSRTGKTATRYHNI